MDHTLVEHAAKQYRYSKDKATLLAWIDEEIEGQAQGVQRMIEDGRYCIDIVQQLTALSSAVDEVALLILQSHIEGCVTNAIRSDNTDGHVKELMDCVRKAMKR